MKKLYILTLLVLIVFMLTGCPEIFYKYSLTTTKYHCSSDLLAKAKKEFGSTAVLADWEDIKSSYGNNIEAFCNDIGLEVGEIYSAFVIRDGDNTYEKDRQYYITRFNGDKPGGYLAHDNIDNNYLCLGSWDECTFRILVRHRIF
ncbi:MAG: hypothetical protein R6U52_01665 [Kosmotogaceae bacterium]